ncbi:MAG: DNA translocase FtsK, partial [Flavobacteriales bacterium]
READPDEAPWEVTAPVLAHAEEEAEEEDGTELELEPVGEEEEAFEEPEATELDLRPVAASIDLSGINDEENGFSVEAAVQEEALSESEIETKLKEFGEYDPTLDLSSYIPPTLDLLVEHSTGELTVTKEELEENKNKIVTTLNNYNIGIEKIKATIGPTVTLYEIVPQAGVRISKIKNLEDDIALSLAALGIRIIAPIPGKGTIGIEVPNSNPQVVSMRAVVASEKFQNSKYDLPIVLGKTISNETFVTDLAKMPHLLMAGATGQGKSVGLNAILVSLLYKKHPSQIKFVLVDPKKVELTLFNKIERHFLAKLPGEGEAIITDTKKVVATLNSLCIEMDERYELLKDAEVRNIKEYNAKFISRRLNPENGHRFLPYIVLVVDEFADLIMTAGREVETPIARLAQLARAIGIHLIIATQRPSVNIITGTIKANFPARIAFRVTSKIDSRTILDSGGADQLIGRGDMLLSTGNELIRIQCAFVDTPEVEAITAFIGNQRGYPDALLLPEVPTEEGETGSVDDGERDSMFEDAARVVVQTQQGSTSLIQRKLKLGYNRAGRIVDQLEAAGILGGFEGSKARKVLVPTEAALDEMLHPAGTAAGSRNGY